MSRSAAAVPAVRSAPRTAGRLDALDGLRTIAVFLVVLFHVAMPGLAAGFIGVDVFFVLSGFLITGGLVRNLERTGRLDLVGFWTKRLRRLMPAAVLVLAVVLSWTYLAAEQFRRLNLSQDVFWTVVYLANWHFMRAASYFSADGTQSPLLHMWSLAVEEQFYLVWPLVLGAVFLAVGRPGARRARQDSVFRTAALVTGVLILASAILLAVLAAPDSPDRAYMGTDTKAFEPLLGALAALLLTRPAVDAWSERHARTLGWAGAAAMVVLLPLMAGPSPFYFVGGALLFCLATAAVIVAAVKAPDWPVARALAWAPMSYLGRISYGIYLWHWPLAVWLDTHAAWRPVEAAGVVVGSVALAALSYHLVETPIRAGRLTRLLTTRRTLGAAATLMAGMVLAASPLGGTPLSPAVIAVLPKPDLDARAIMLVGDSVPQRFLPALAEAGEQRGLTIGASTAGGCSPLGVRQEAGPGLASDMCLQVPDRQRVGLSNMNPRTVVWWSRYEVADRYQGDRLLTAGTDEFWDAQLADFRASVDRLTAEGATLVVVLTERPGIGMRTRCSASSCHPFLQRLVLQDDLRRHWNDLVKAESTRDRRLRVISLDDAICRTPSGTEAQSTGFGAGVLCDDTVSPGKLARPDGSHFDNALVGERLSEAFIDRVTEAVGP